MGRPSVLFKAESSAITPAAAKIRGATHPPQNGSRAWLAAKVILN